MNTRDEAAFEYGRERCRPYSSDEIQQAYRAGWDAGNAAGDSRVVELLQSTIARIATDECNQELQSRLDAGLAVCGKWKGYGLPDDAFPNAVVAALSAQEGEL